MATLRQIRRRIRSIQSTAKITRAMELVAASKMRRAQARALAGRPYAEKMRWVLADLAETAPFQDPEALHPLLRRRDEVKAVEVIHITPDRGLCGGQPANLNRRVAAFILERSAPVRLVAVGRKGRDFLRRTGQNVVAEFIGLGDNPSYEDIRPIAQVAMQDFVAEAVDEVYLLYARFESTMVQRPTLFKLLPVEPPTEAATWGVDYIYEPDRAAELAAQGDDGLKAARWFIERSARVVAMRNATDNANEMIRELTLVYNKARQESITKELLDITGGVEALRVAR